MTTIVDGTPVTVAELVAAVRDQQSTTVSRLPQPVAQATAVSVDVLGAHGGAGASTVALALAEELADQASAPDDPAGAPVRLVDLAVRESSGLVAAAEREVASEYDGWRASRRGPVVIYSPDPGHRSSPDARTAALIAGVGHTVVDLGRPWPCETPTHPDDGTLTVLVCRSTVPGVRRAERASAELGSDVLLAAVGSPRWRSDLVATFGPRTQALVEAGRCVLFPSDRRLERSGPDSSPLPKPVTVAARRLADLLRLSTTAGVLP